MIYTERLLRIIDVPHISEKTSILLDKKNILVLRVAKHATKIDIKHAICMLFSVQIKKINVLIVSGKIKGSRANRNLRNKCNWKKAYVVLKDGYKLNLVNEIK